MSIQMSIDSPIIITYLIYKTFVTDPAALIQMQRNSAGCKPTLLFISLWDYIIPPMPPWAAGAGTSDLISATTDSVVNNVAATLVAF